MKLHHLHVAERQPGANVNAMPSQDLSPDGV
jgi:hypothetical protein